MLTLDTSPPTPPIAEDVVRSVFELGGNRLSIFEVDEVIDIVRSILTKGSNPVQEESISSSSTSHPSSSTSFWFLLSSTGSIDYVSETCLPLLGYRPSELRHKSAFSIVAIRDHHILPPILSVGPCTSMSCRLHLLKESQEAPFDVTFAKLSTRQLNSDIEKERSATLCVARAIPISHGKVVLQLDSCSRVIDVENISELSINTSLLLSRHISELVVKTDAAVLDTLLEAHSECSAQLSLQLSGISAGAMVRSVHLDGGVVILHCEINKIENLLPLSDSIGGHGVSVVSNNDTLSEICSSVFNDDVAHPTGSLTLYCSSPSLPPVLQPMIQLPSTSQKPKKAKKPKVKKQKLLEKDSCLKRLLATRAPDLLSESASSDDFYVE